MTPEQFERLPLYAKKEIEKLRRELAHAQREWQACLDKSPTRIRWGYDFDGQSFGFIRDTETVCFMTRKHRGAIRVRLIEDGGAININGDDRLLLEMTSGNDCTVRLKP